MLASLAREGVALALGSDGSPEEANPFLNILLASTYAAAPGEALSREQALLVYTAGGAHAERAERTTGRLVPGLAANLAVLRRTSCGCQHKPCLPPAAC
jgi:predicted amidohydrolase YtcJ